MKTDGIGWLIAAVALWPLVFAEDQEIYTWVGGAVLFVAAVTCSIQAISKFFPYWFDPVEAIARKMGRSKSKD